MNKQIIRGECSAHANTAAPKTAAEEASRPRTPVMPTFSLSVPTLLISGHSTPKSRAKEYLALQATRVNGCGSDAE